MNERIRLLFTKFSKHEDAVLPQEISPKVSTTQQVSLKAQNLISSLSLLRIEIWKKLLSSNNQNEDRINEHHGTHSIDILEGAIKALVEVAIPADLERLKRHQRNISRWKLVFDVRRLKREYESTNRTVKQIASSLQELEILRSRIRVEDLKEFDELVECVAHESNVAIKRFMDDEMPDKKTRQQLKSQDRNCSPQLNHHRKLSRQQCMSQSLSELPVGDFGLGTSTYQAQKLAFDSVDGENTSQVLDSMIKLQKDVEDLNELMTTFSGIVSSQTEVVDTISENIDEAEENISRGNFQLKKANILKVALFPTVGAIVGGAVGGPIGALAGIKLGTSISGGLAAAGVTGSIIGYQSGKYLKKKKIEGAEAAINDCDATNDHVLTEEMYNASDGSSLESFEILSLSEAVSHDWQNLYTSDV